MAANTIREAFDVISRPFPSEEVEWRVQRSGESGGKVWAVVIPYITARAVHDRLDEAFGPWGWRSEFRVMEMPGGTSGVICRTYYMNPETGEWDWKENGSDQSDIEPFKGGLSDAEKRTFEQFGGGRYLYRLGDEFAETSTARSDRCPNYAKTKQGTVFYWGPPLLPEFALPQVKLDVQEEADDLFGEPVDERILYPVFDKAISFMAGKRGVTELKQARVLAQRMKLQDVDVIEVADDAVVDLFIPLKYEECIAIKKAMEEKLRDMMKHRKG